MKVNEIAGLGNHTTALFWEWDTRTGRRWNLDPKPDPSLSNYSGLRDNPIWHNDPLGDIVVFDKSATPEFKKQWNKAVGYLAAHHRGQNIIQLANSKYVFTIKENMKPDDKFIPIRDDERKATGGGTILWNPHLGLRTTNDVFISPTTALDHEDEHAAGNAKSPTNFDKLLHTPDKKYDNKEEKRVITGTEQKTARALGETNKVEKTREDHSAKELLQTSDPTSVGGATISPK